MAAGGVSATEVARFEALADAWWAPDGPLALLHRMNPVRIGWIATQIAAHYGSEARPTVLDVGCGAGIAAEALARRGHPVLGVDAAAAPLAAARAHAAGCEHPLDLTYRQALLADLLAERARFPVVTALEVIEHVPEPAAFVTALAGLVAPGGLVVLSTLNRSLRSRLFAKYAAEYVLRWVPPGTHDWHCFLKPAELAGMARAAGLHVTAVTGISLGLNGGFRLGRDTGINYMLAAIKPAA
ncbi:MAG: bifunctional 2-polyprenyl-6-hydroxyphenol methylase/3-demethylubiquinol 3-O-methyltransferase UbiG [Rhodospirillales bacterium]|nr:bifunctional 2-polyprenyl-6-hydroxyphenol methylase/3-demethylubiquinol 3-O-methyltransferase UbiG [Rhodospirillales bacterium]